MQYKLSRNFINQMSDVFEVFIRYLTLIIHIIGTSVFLIILAGSLCAFGPLMIHGTVTFDDWVIYLRSETYLILTLTTGSLLAGFYVAFRGR